MCAVTYLQLYNKDNASNARKVDVCVSLHLKHIINLYSYLGNSTFTPNLVIHPSDF